MGGPESPRGPISSPERTSDSCSVGVPGGHQGRAVPGQILLAGGSVEDESDLKVIELGPQKEEEVRNREE